MKQHVNRLNRRDFLYQAALLATGVAVTPGMAAVSQDTAEPRIVVFSKVYQELKLGFEDSAQITAEAGLAGVDCALRPGGEIEPARVNEDLPRYLEALRKHGLSMPMIASGITGLNTPHAETVLREVSKAGIRHYRLAPIRPDKDPSKRRQQVIELRARLADLAKLNRELGLTAVVQNHSPGNGYLGGDVGELAQILEGFNPKQVGAAFDLGHAIVVHGQEWRTYFDKVRTHQQLAYVKDVTAEGKWVRFGEGEFSRTNYFTLLKQIGYSTPYSIHIEFDWNQAGKKKSRDVLLQALQESRQKLQEWLSKA